MGPAEVTGDLRLIRTRWEIRTDPGEPPVRGDLRVAEGTTPTRAVVICHGFKGFKDWAFFPVLARSLAAHGFAAVTFNFSRSGVGEDDVDFSALERFGEQTHTRNVREILAVLQAVRGGRILPGRLASIGLFGHSRGGGEAVLAADDDPEVGALVTWSAVSRMDRWSEEQKDVWERGEPVYIANARTGQQMPVGPGYWRDLNRNGDRLDILAAAARLDAPWLVVHAEDDETVAVAEGRALQAAAGPRSELLLLAGTGHTFGATHPCERVSPELEAAIQVTRTWFDTHLARE